MKARKQNARLPSPSGGSAKRENVGLKVLTTHGRTGLERVVTGSRAERVVRHAYCPAYVVRSFGQWPRKPPAKD